ncbi:4a-hydroxytetrahydrobiopterin dehydratase [Massilia phyllosphaerae]|uniref:4a-hydroxytetrahydrobiopterin dehydratase n=1 Tax=Massilia phyllosphaerae TaxID=3106034 RepID=UPI002B1CB6CB|nr:4a-hydroxytetrahydrobiopterin dehydratase [Massilia sp. SGZ-792]
MKLLARHCSHGAPALDDAAIAALLPQVPAWHVEDDHLQREYAFRDYHETIAFVNALAWMIHGQDHHPQLLVSYRHCGVAFTTHSAGNHISENDFICAAKADAIYTERASA